jgi:APA family basic amino acid/polyamine antiporter
MNTPKQSLGLFDATTIVMGSMIGSGVFIVAADIGRQVGSPGMMLMAWVATALLTLLAALSYGELAAMMPKAGGQYIYLREAFGPLYGFLYGWTFFTVIQTGTIAAVAVAFAKFLGVFVPELSQKGVAMVLIVFLTWLNTRGLRTGAIVQNVFTVAKTGALLGLIGAAFLFGRSDAAIARNFGANFWAGGFDGLTALRVLGVALVGSLFSSDSWNNVTFTAGETRNPERNVPLSLLLGVGLVSVLYLLANYAYLLVLPFDQIQNAAEDRVGTAAASAILGPVAVQVMAAAIMVSTFGCANGLTLAGARVYYAMALDNLFFRQAARLDPRTQAPSTSLWIQCLWACGLTLTGSYSDLLDYVIFAVLLFYILTIVGIFVLRRKRPEAPRPYKAFGYPLLPGLYILLASGIELLLLLYKPSFTWPGLVIVLLGIPVYFWWTKGKVNA